MTKNVFLQTSNLTGLDLKKFSDWLAEYDAENQYNAFLEDHPGVFADLEISEDIQKIKKVTAKDFSKPCPGQIRLLNAELTANQEIITPILVLTQWSNNQWLIAPFSRFHTPATTGEIATTGLDFHAYSVLEVWNTAVVPEFFLYQDSLFLRMAPEKTRLEACQLFFHLLANDELPQSVAEKLGAPIASKLDPRIQYLLGEEEQMKGVHTEAERLQDLFAQFSESIFESPEGKIVLAAGEADEKNLYFSIEGSAAVLRCFAEDDTLRIRVFTNDLKNYSDVFNNWSLLSTEGQILGCIADGKAEIKGIDQQVKLCLASPDGTLHKLMKQN